MMLEEVLGDSGWLKVLGAGLIRCDMQLLDLSACEAYQLV